MAARDTSTGEVFERMILPALYQGRYTVHRKVNIGGRPGGRRHIADVVAYDNDDGAYLVSLKWQQASGTAEQKVPFEVICLAEARLSQPDKYKNAYIVLGGLGWTLRDFYIGGGLSKYLLHCDLVNIVELEKFIALANHGQL